MPVHVARKINLEGREAGFFFEVMATRTLDFLGDTIRRGFALVKDSYQLVWKRKPLLRLYGAKVGAGMSEAGDEADAIEQEREVEATEEVEPASEAEGEIMEEETEEESEEHESEQIEDRKIKTTREEKRKRKG